MSKCDKLFKAFCLLGVGSLFAVTGSSTLAQGPTAITCPAQSLQSAINAGFSPITFDGTCNENIFILGRSGVTIQGNPAVPNPDVIALGLSTRGTQALTLQNLTIEAPSGGVFFTEGTAARLVSVTVQNTRDGVGALRSTMLNISNSNIGDASGTNGTQSAAALLILEDSHLRMTGTTVTSDSSNPAIGGTLAVVRDSSATLRSGNTITSTGSEPAVDVLFDSSLRSDNPLIPDTLPTDPARDVFTGTVALRMVGNAYGDIRQTQVNGDTEVSLDSVLRIASLFFGSDPNLIEFNGNITASKASKVDIASPLVTVNGDITCLDKSSFGQGAFQGTGDYVKCRDFNRKKAKKSGQSGGDDDD